MALLMVKHTLDTGNNTPEVIETFLSTSAPPMSVLTLVTGIG